MKISEFLKLSLTYVIKFRDMKKILVWCIFSILFVSCKDSRNHEKNDSEKTQIPDSNGSDDIDETNKYHLFYLHGGIVEEQGENAVSEQFGPYEYRKILDSLRSRGFIVHSEVRPKGTQIELYARKLAAEVEQLIQTGVPASEITIVGASLGGYITLDASLLLDNPDIHYVVLGLCGTYALNLYQSSAFKGRFLSVYENSDTHGSCASIFKKMEPDNFQEVGLNTGLDHGFLYKPDPRWIDPIVKWSGIQ